MTYITEIKNTIDPKIYYSNQLKLTN